MARCRNFEVVQKDYDRTRKVELSQSLWQHLDQLEGETDMEDQEEIYFQEERSVMLMVECLK